MVPPVPPCQPTIQITEETATANLFCYLISKFRVMVVKTMFSLRQVQKELVDLFYYHMF